MNFIESIVDGFILTVGITPPRPERRRLAVVFIATGLIGTIVGLIAFVTMLVPHLFTR